MFSGFVMFFKNFKCFSIVGMVFLLSACATEYQSQGLTGGFNDTLTGPNTATVSFKSNAFTSMEQTKSFAFRRAAEITLQNGYDYFLVENNNQFVKEEQLQGTVSCTTTGYGSTYTTYNTNCNNIGGGTITKPRVELEIRMFNGDVPNETGYYDARFLAGS